MRAGSCLLIPAFAVLAGCQQKMAEQPSYRPLVPSHLFADGTSARPLPPGVMAREWRTSDDPIVTGLKPQPSDASPATTSGETSTRPSPGAPTDPAKFVEEFPFEVTRSDLARGQERYTIFCAVCHDPIGTGRGKIVERGYVRPPNFHADASRGFGRYGKTIRLRDVPIGYIFEVITHGYGAMPRYGPRVAARDRWRIAAYLRALQMSQHAEIADLPEDARRAARAALEGRP
jgi:mono/diheme cytochrome c family protein